MTALNEIIDKRLLIFITNEVIEYYNFLGIALQTKKRLKVKGMFIVEGALS